MKLITEAGEKAPPPEVVARLIGDLMDAQSPPFRSVVGKDAHALIALRRMIPDRFFAGGVRRLVGLQRLR